MKHFITADVEETARRMQGGHLINDGRDQPPGPILARADILKNKICDLVKDLRKLRLMLKKIRECFSQFTVIT